MVPSLPLDMVMDSHLQRTARFTCLADIPMKEVTVKQYTRINESILHEIAYHIDK